MAKNQVILSTGDKLLTRRNSIDRGYISPCWEYTGSRNEKGYGVIKLSRGPSTQLVHRLAARLWLKDYKNSLFTLHKCNNPPCFNPDHLYQGTNSQNMIDAVNNGTHFQSKKKFCPKGHPYDEVNTLIKTDKRGRTGRWCKTCIKNKVR